MKKYLRHTFIYQWYKTTKAWLAMRWYGNPSAQMMVIGVTGTDGKTTTSSLIHHLITTCLGKCVFVGTTGILIGNEWMHGVTKMTSYDPFQLQRILAYARTQGCTYAVLEVSSHGLDQKRFLGINFQGAVLTNITPEHLDYHKTMEQYAAAKRKLFELVAAYNHPDACMILPMDDERGKQRYQQFSCPHKISYGFTDDATITAQDITQHTEYTTFMLHNASDAYHIQMQLVGKFNVANCLAARSVGESLGITPEAMQQAIGSFQRVTGRQEHLSLGGVERYIDYAHTPRGLEVTLEFLQSIKGEGRVIAIFGAPGKRDRAKRPLMGSTVARMADLMIVTDDDPDSEPREQILQDIMSGINRELGDDYWVIPNRRDAIYFAAQLVRPSDVVLLAGIGHQDVLYTNYGVIPWDEKEVVREAVAHVHR